MKSAIHPSLSNQQPTCYSQRITAFVTAGADSPEPLDHGGNPCLLFSHEAPPTGPLPLAAGTTLCQSWPTQYEGQPVIAVACYTAAGQAIQCCGHGLLSAAHSWLERLQCEELSLLMNNSLVSSWREQANTWLQFIRPPTTALVIPDWVAEIFPAQLQPVAAAISGDERGYLILQWPDGAMLKTLVPSLEQLADHTTRALICTSAQPSQRTDAIQLRYFAPQYGVNEDTATGSAMRVLAAYWSHRYLTLTAQQCSPKGGFLLSRITRTHAQIGGRCYSEPISKP